MSKKQILMACGTAVLAVATFFVAKANRVKYAATQTAYFYNNGGTLITLFKGQTGGANMHLTTAVTSGHTAFIRTSGMGTGTPLPIRTLFANNTSFTTLFYK